MLLYKLKKLHQQPTSNLKKFKRHDQVRFFQELGELLDSGYSIVRSLDVLEKSHPQWQPKLVYVQKHLAQGSSLVEALRPFISTAIALQLSLAKKHGDLAQTLIILGKNLSRISQQEEKLKQVMRYPLILLVLLALMLIALRYFLYPIMSQWSSANVVDSRLDLLLVGGGLATLIATLVIWHWWTKKTALSRLNLLVHLPIIGGLVKTALTYQLSQQLAMLLSSGLTIPEIIEELVQQPADNLVVDLARLAQASLSQGGTLENFIWQQPYFNASVAGYFTRGHTTDKLSAYLAYYAKLQFNALVRQTDRLIASLQPIFFAVVGLAIVGLYLAMLLPMYQNIGGMN
ncbi:type II secretion system F family protein [Convivina intestini]|uniref:type II secretion system F family protein n=1 Tax=Convivina intestini TaxID=1505726 RepID=UPI00200F25C3|nr:type II secretion system F family protein [Convivina intestini]